MAELRLTEKDFEQLAEIGRTIRDEGLPAAQVMLQQSKSLQRAMEGFEAGFSDRAEFTALGNACTFCTGCVACGWWFPAAHLAQLSAIVHVAELRVG